MQMSPYLSFNGQCEEAFQFYARCLGGRMGELFRYGGSPMADQVPAGWEQRIMHGTLTLGNQVLMGCDSPPGQFEAAKGTSLSLHTTDAAEAERVYRELADGGQIIMPLERTFWAERFGMLVDRYGIPWMVNCDAAQQQA